jgi:hypothetical protein
MILGQAGVNRRSVPTHIIRSLLDLRSRATTNPPSRRSSKQTTWPADQNGWSSKHESTLGSRNGTVRTQSSQAPIASST